MEALSELIELVTQKRVKKVELFDENSRNKTSNYYRLFEGIHSKRYHTDQEAAQDIYQCEASAKKYLILKTRLKQKLLNTLFFLDLNHNDHLTEREVILQECNKALYYTKTLILNRSNRVAIPTVEKTHKKAQEYELTWVEMECAHLLRQHHFQENNYKDFLTYKNIGERLERKMMAENRAQKYYEELLSTHKRSANHREAILDKSEDYLQQLHEDIIHFNSHLIKSYYLKIKIFRQKLSNDYQEALHTLQEQEQHQTQHQTFFSQSQMEELQLEKMLAFLHVPQTAPDQKPSPTCHIFEEGSPNWYKLQEYKLLSAMHQQSYLLAAQVFQSVLQQSSFRQLSNLKKEKWKTIQAYLHYVYKFYKQKEIRDLIQNSKITFKLSEYADDRPPFSKERRSLNINILASQIMFYIERLDWDGVKDCIKALEPYCRRYPKKDINFRSECFISMQMQMAKEDFRFYQTRKSTEKLYQDMVQTPRTYNGVNKGLEIIPYELIWQRIMEKLKTHRYG